MSIVFFGYGKDETDDCNEILENFISDVEVNEMKEFLNYLLLFTGSMNIQKPSS